MSSVAELNRSETCNGIDIFRKITGNNCRQFLYFCIVKISSYHQYRYNRHCIIRYLLKVSPGIDNIRPILCFWTNYTIYKCIVEVHHEKLL